MVEHTPAPWTRACFQIYGSDKSRVAHTGMGQLPPHRSHESEANAEFIVRAVNSHDALVKALKEVEELSNNCVNAQHYDAQDALEDLQAIRRAIARARASLPRHDLGSGK